MSENIASRTRIIARKLIFRLTGYRPTFPIVLHPYKAVYYVIPKTASKSLKSFFADSLSINQSSSMHSIRFPHASQSELDTEYQDYFRFCFTRNPWDRLVDIYYMKVKQKEKPRIFFMRRFIAVPFNIRLYELLSKVYGGKTQFTIPFIKEKIFTPEISFDDFIDLVARTPDNKIDKHLRPQFTYVCDEDGKLLVNYIGKFERLSEDLKYICNYIGIQNHQLKHIGDTSKIRDKNYMKYYTQETWEKVRNRYKQDIEKFGYNIDFIDQ